MEMNLSSHLDRACMCEETQMTSQKDPMSIIIFLLICVVARRPVLKERMKCVLEHYCRSLESLSQYTHDAERPYKPHVDRMSENSPAFARPALGSGTKCRVMNHQRETDGFGRSSATGVHTLL